MPKAKPKHHEVSRGYILKYEWVKNTLLSGLHLNCNEIAEKLDCNPKTAQRYINRLRADGYKIDFDISLNGFVIVAPKKPEKMQQSDLYVVLRRAYTWANQYHPHAPWLPDAKTTLRI